MRVESSVKEDELRAVSGEEAMTFCLARMREANGFFFNCVLFVFAVELFFREPPRGRTGGLAASTGTRSVARAVRSRPPRAGRGRLSSRCAQRLNETLCAGA